MTRGSTSTSTATRSSLTSRPRKPDTAAPAPSTATTCPVRHFGVVLSMDEWNALAARLRSEGTKFIIEPHIRFKGEVGEQATMFFLDPCGNALEFKAFADPSRLFAK